MTGVRLYNTKARAKQDFTPIDPLNVRMYVCGPTVYDRAHLGNARPVIVFDTLYRLLRHLYGPDHVTYVRNFTDVDDKINAEALRRQKAGATGTLEDLIRERTNETIAQYHEDMDDLGALRPSIKGVVSDEAAPRATEFIAQMVTMIEDLMARTNEEGLAYAYAREGHVLFRVRAYKDYGKLSGRTVDDMIAGARVEVAPFKEDPMDFVLWKPSSGEEPGWASPWGKGRPGWHIECSAMAQELLGESFDIHGGGLDLQFPHHENEIAQSACAHPHGDFAHYWMHNEMLQVEGKKMSKSLGNFFTVRDLLDQGVPGEVIRFVFLMTHYRKPMDWTTEKARQAEATLRKWSAMVNDRRAVARKANVLSPYHDQIVVGALSDDLNTHGALARLHELYSLSHEANSEGNRSLAMLYHSLNDLIGIDLLKVHELLRPRTVGDEIDRLTLDAAIDTLEARDAIEWLVQRRVEAKAKKDFAEADRLRQGLSMAGITLKDTPSGSTWELGPDFDPAKLEALQ